MNRLTASYRNQHGGSLIEFTLVGIPLIFVLISTFEISRGMWMYHTLAYAVKEGVRFAEVHGINCINTADNPNNCPKTIADVTQKIRDAGIGLDPATTFLTFTPGATTSRSMVTCLADTTVWPPNDTILNAVGQPIRIDITTPFNNAIALFWPGSAPQSFGSFTLGASSTDYIQF